MMLTRASLEVGEIWYSRFGHADQIEDWHSHAEDSGFWEAALWSWPLIVSTSAMAVSDKAIGSTNRCSGKWAVQELLMHSAAVPATIGSCKALNALERKVMAIMFYVEQHTQWIAVWSQIVANSLYHKLKRMMCSTPLDMRQLVYNRYKPSEILQFHQYNHWNSNLGARHSVA